MPPALTAAPEDRAGAILTVDLAAIVENWRRLKQLAGKVKMPKG